MKKTNKECTGTSFHGTVIKATVNDLIEVCGEADFADNDGEDKVNFEWEMENNNGNVFTIYDWKEYRPIAKDGLIEWHIGGRDLADTEQGKDELQQALNNL